MFERLQAYCEHEKIPFNISLEDRKAIGELVRAAYFKRATQEKPVYVGKREVREPEGIFTVLVYPNRFGKVIDAIIIQQLKQKKTVR